MVQGWINDPPVTVEPFQFSPAEPVAYEWSYRRYPQSVKIADLTLLFSKLKLTKRINFRYSIS